MMKDYQRSGVGDEIVNLPFGRKLISLRTWNMAWWLTPNDELSQPATLLGTPV